MLGWFIGVFVWVFVWLIEDLITEKNILDRYLYHDWISVLTCVFVLSGVLNLLIYLSK